MKKLLFIFCFAYNFSFAQNLVLNPGFETATMGMPGGNTITFYPTIMDHWTAVDIDGEFIMDPTYAHSGNGFLSVLQNFAGNTQTNWLGAPHATNGYDRVMQNVSVLPNTQYELKFWYRSGNNLRYQDYSDGNVLVQLEQISPINQTITSFSVATTTNWQQSTQVFTTGPTCTNIALLFSALNLAASCDSWIDDVYIGLFSDPESIDENEINNIVTISPNPVNNFLNINTNNNLENEISIYDLTSKIIHRSSFVKETKITTSQLSKGMYIYEIKNNKGILKKSTFIKE